MQMSEKYEDLSFSLSTGSLLLSSEYAGHIKVIR